MYTNLWVGVNVYVITSAGGSARGYVLPPMIIYLRKTSKEPF